MARILALSEEQFSLYLLVLYLKGDPALMRALDLDEEDAEEEELTP